MTVLQVDHRRLSVLDDGAGDPPVVFLHAFPLSSAMWEEQVRAFGDSHRIIAPDLMGFGGSEAPADPSRYSVERWADDVAAVVAQLGFDRVVVVGLSTGGSVALSLVQRFRDVVGGLVLADTRAEADNEAELLERSAQQRWLARGGEFQPLADRWLDAMVGTHTTRRAEVMKKARWMLSQQPRAGLVGALEALQHQPDYTDELHKVDIPTLVLVGARDRLTPPASARILCEALPNVSYAVIHERCGPSHQHGEPRPLQPGAAPPPHSGVVAAIVSVRTSSSVVWVKSS